MSDAQPPRPDSITVTFTYAVAELAAYRTQAHRRYQASESSGNGSFELMFFVVALAVVAGFVAFGLGAVTDIRNPSVALLCGATYYAARFFEAHLGTRQADREWRAATAPVLETAFTFEIDAEGVTIACIDARRWLAWRRITQVTSKDELITFWFREMEGFVLPKRVLADGEADRIITLARAARMATA